MKLTTLQKKTINELIQYIELEQKNPVIEFDMGVFAVTNNGDEWMRAILPEEVNHECGTTCCLLGLHGSHNDVTKAIDWDEYAELVGIPKLDELVGIPELDESRRVSRLWNALFDSAWSSDLEAAKQRCIWILENEASNWECFHQDKDTYGVTVHRIGE